jgi:predicted kinase
MDRSASNIIRQVRMDQVHGRPLLVCVSGKPGSGKSTMARTLGEALWLLVLSGDAVGAGLAETAAELDPQNWEQPSGRIKVDAFYAIIETALRLGVSVVAELSFRRGLDEPRLRPLQAIARVVNVHCDVPTRLAVERFGARETGPREQFRQTWLRHRPDRRPSPGALHYYEQMKAGDFDWSIFAPLDLDVSRLTVDTTDGYAPSVDAVVAFCRGAQLGATSA